MIKQNYKNNLVSFKQDLAVFICMLRIHVKYVIFFLSYWYNTSIVLQSVLKCTLYLIKYNVINRKRVFLLCITQWSIYIQCGLIR